MSFRTKFILQEGEILKRVPNCPWQISSYGRIKTDKGKSGGWEKKLCISNAGYYFSNYKAINYYIHRLVVEVFIEAIPEGMVVNHIDGNKLNNRLDNLEIITYGENTRHAYDFGLMEGKSGEENSMSKITDEKARLLIQDVLDGLSNDEIAEKYNLHSRYISLIRHKKRWKKLWEEEFNSTTTKVSHSLENKRKLTKSQYLDVIHKLKNGRTNVSIEKEYNLSSGTGSRIRHGQMYSDWWMELSKVI